MSEPYFLIAAPDWTPASAGVRACHLLCHMIRELGYRAYLNPCVKNPDLVTPLWHSGVKGKRIAVYPEGIHGNPLQGDVVARWLLFHQQHNFVSQSDLFFSWDKSYDRAGVYCLPLRIPIIEENYFWPPGPDVARDTVCYYAHKFRAGGGIVPQEIRETCVDIDSFAPGDRRAIADLFRRSKYLIVWEQTACSEEAMLCGCPTVNLASEYYKQFPPEEATVGISLTLNEEDIERARVTLPERFRMFMRRKKESGPHVERFINLCLSEVE